MRVAPPDEARHERPPAGSRLAFRRAPGSRRRERRGARRGSGLRARGRERRRWPCPPRGGRYAGSTRHLRDHEILRGGRLSHRARRHSRRRHDRADPRRVRGGVSAAQGQTASAGGHLNIMLREDLPQGFAVHGTSTISTSFPSMPCFSNLVLFDQLKRVESPDTLVGELAEKWSWQDGYRNLVFFLRSDVKWHDGKPFTSKDVKFTFDMVREAPKAQAKLRINPRKDWYASVEAIEAPDPHTVVFRLKRPQPSLLLMFASGYSPVYAAHVPPASYRTGCVGTGPFKVKEWRKGEFVDYVKNTDYFVKDRPYLDSIRYVVIENRGTRVSALQAGKLDVSFPGEMTKTSAEQIRKAVPQMVVTTVGQTVSDNIIMNVKKPPFDNIKVRLAASRAIDRRLLTHPPPP